MVLVVLPLTKTSCSGSRVKLILALLTTSTLPMALAEDASIPHRPLERLMTATPLPALRRLRGRVDSYRWRDSSRLESP